ncbi:MAG TPA: ABC transporter permease [Vicinamibacterales bacterium]|nr:ABC transporter permease [Vicinamibacterales bacterium]
MIDTIWQDVKYAARSLRRTPAFAAAAIITLALGIGANTAMFGVADATALRPPDVPRPGEIVRVFSSTPEAPYGDASYPDYLDFRANATTLSGLIAYETADFALARNRDQPAQYLGGWAVSSNFFAVLGVEPTLGRGFRADDERSMARVAVISHRLWVRAFASAPTVVGTHILLSGADFTIVGVAPEAFTGTELYFHPDVFIPLTALRSVLPALPANVLDDRASQWLTLLGRLRNRTNAEQATSELAVLASGLRNRYPDTNRSRTALVLPELTARARLDSGGVQGAFILMGLVGLLLLLACANVANLMLSRRASRTREMALRAAVGATRRRLIAQLMTESLLLAFCGGAIGLLVAEWTRVYLSTVLVIPSALPLSIDLRLDARVLLFAVVMSLVTGVLFGITPALQSARAGLSSWLKQRDEGSTGRRITIRSALVGLQVAICVVVLASSGLLIRAFLAAQRVDPGFRTDRILLVSFNPGLVRYDAPQARRFYEQLVERTRALPGVAAVGLTRYVPLGVTNGSVTVTVDGARMPGGGDRVTVAETTVDDGYWAVMRTPIVHGRGFDARDTATSPRVAIVNETMAKQYWPDQDPVGKTVRIPDVPTPNGPQTIAMEVVGVARDGKYWELAESTRPFIYRPFSQGRRIAMTMVVLTRGEPAAIASAVRAASASVDSSVPVFDVQTLDSLYRSRALLPSRLMSQLVTSIGVLGLLLASVGLYGVIAFLSTRRTREIGVRMAVGASRGGVLRMALWQAAGLLLPGLALGVALAALLTPLLGSPAFDFVSPYDPLVMTLAPLVTAGVAMLAAALPAIRASRIDPTMALRAD